MEKWPAHPAGVENLNFPHKNISGWLKILTCGSHCPPKLRDRSLASAVRHRYGIKNVSRGFSGLIMAAGRPCRMGRREGWRSRARAGLCPDPFLCHCHPQAAESWLRGCHPRGHPMSCAWNRAGQTLLGLGELLVSLCRVRVGGTCHGVRAAPTPCHPTGHPRGCCNTNNG